MSFNKEMIGFWNVNYAKANLADIKLKAEDVDGKLSDLAAELNLKTPAIEEQFNCKFEPNEKDKRVEVARKKYIRFTDMNFDYNLAPWDKFYDPSFEDKDRFIELFKLISLVRIDINPCFEPLKYHEENHKTKFYVIPWNTADIPAEMREPFLKVCHIVSDRLSEAIREYYGEIMAKLIDGYHETYLTNKFYTAVYYSEKMAAEYEQLIETIDEEHSIDRNIVNQIWDPLLNYGNSIFKTKTGIEEYRPFIQQTMLDTFERGDKGVFGITKKVVDEVTITYLIGFSPYPRSLTLGIHLPIIKRT